MMNTTMKNEKHYGDCPCRPDQIGILIPGKQGKLLSVLYTAGGEGNHPSILLFHGIPGCEQNLDLAQELRRAGFHVMTFHYSGSWGSDGNYSIQSDLDDANSILDFILKDETYHFDKDRIYAVGHSLGGFVCAHILENRDEIKGGALLMPCNVGRMEDIAKSNPQAEAIIKDVLDESADWLKGVEKNQLYKESLENKDVFCLEKNAKKLIEKPLLCVTGSLDIYTPKMDHAQPLLDAIKESGGSKVIDLTYPTDHSFCDYRVTICEKVVEFFSTIAFEE